MVYNVCSTPADTAQLFRDFHSAPNRVERERLIQAAPLPAGAILSLKQPKSDTLDQGRLNLPKVFAERVDRVFGVATHINATVIRRTLGPQRAPK